MTDMRPAEVEPSTEQMDCPTCEHRVRPDTRQGASMVSGTVVVVHRCPGCGAILRTEVV